MKQKRAVVFPGQGSQSVGMLRDDAIAHPEIRNTFDQASNQLGYDLWELIQSGPKEKLDQTIYAQPALLTASYALWKIFSAQHPHPELFAGHSLGEYTSLVCAGSLSFEDSVSLVAARGQLMQEAMPVGEGGMAALIGLEKEVVINICREAVSTDTEILAPANYNSLGQIVIAGHMSAVQRAMTLAKNAGAKLVILLPVSVPSHCALMEPAAYKLKILLDKVELKIPSIPVISNVDVTPYTSVEQIRDGLVRQLFSPVRWVETIQYFVGCGVTEIIECGPGKILTGLNKRINTSIKCDSFSAK